MSKLNTRHLVEEFLSSNGHNLDNFSEELLGTLQVMVETTFQKSILDTRMILSGLSDEDGNVNAKEAKECVRGLLVDYGILQDVDPEYERLKRTVKGFAEDSLANDCLFQSMPDTEEHDWDSGDPETLETIVELVFSTEDESVYDLYADNILNYLQEEYPDYA